MNLRGTMVWAAMILSLSLSVNSFAERENGGRRAPMAVEIIFSSTGTGIDGNAFHSVLDLVNEGLGDGTIVLIKNEKWGREGERTICVEFSKWTDTFAFSKSVQNVIANDKRTATKFQLSCLPTIVRPNE